MTRLEMVHQRRRMRGWCQTILLLVTAVVRSYNRADYLREAIDSVLGQTRPPDQVVVVDDGSTDATPDVLASYGSAVEVVGLAHSGNPAAVLNAGLRAARGDLVALLDSDDIWLPDKLALQHASFSDARVGFAYGNVCLLWADGQRSAPVLRADQIVSGCLLPTLVRDMCVHPSTLVVRRALVGQLDESERVNEDFFLLLRLAREASGACVREPVALIRQHPGMLSAAHGLEAYIASIRALSGVVRDATVSRSVRLDARRSMGRYQAHVARQLVVQGRFGAARAHALAALAQHPLHRPAWRWAAVALVRGVCTK
jgi:glycosyltransferase involved in cell wall biosynthesis